MAGKADVRDLTGWDKLVAFLKGAIAKIANGLGVKIPKSRTTWCATSSPVCETRERTLCT
jgi:hypothetical protein